MESSQVRGGSDQESGDSESGWTMYIGSQICNENYGEADDGKDNENKPVFCGGVDDESDDSMASDASSGPIIHELNPDGVKEESEMFGHARCFSAKKKTCKQEAKRDERRIRREKKDQEKVPLKAESAQSQV